jgi:Icc-related predicted phosphoesterase
MDSVTINGFKIWGTPYVPRYGDWAFMKPRSEMMKKVWDFMPNDTDILVTHTPPQGVLDATSSYIYNPEANIRVKTLENVGCKSLAKKVFQIEPKIHCFGHIHGSKDIYNSGTKTLSGFKTIFSNAACCIDRERNRMQLNGNVIELKDENYE